MWYLFVVEWVSGVAWRALRASPGHIRCDQVYDKMGVSSYCEWVQLVGASGSRATAGPPSLQWCPAVATLRNPAPPLMQLMEALVWRQQYCGAY